MRTALVLTLLTLTLTASCGPTLDAPGVVREAMCGDEDLPCPGEVTPSGRGGGSGSRGSGSASGGSGTTGSMDCAFCDCSAPDTLPCKTSAFGIVNETVTCHRFGASVSAPRCNNCNVADLARQPACCTADVPSSKPCYAGTQEGSRTTCADASQVWLIPNAGVCDSDEDGLRDEDEHQLAADFAPRFEHHRETSQLVPYDEEYLPSMVEFYLLRSSLRFHHDASCDDHPVLWSVTPSNLIAQTHQLDSGSMPLTCGSHREWVKSNMAIGGDETFFLEMNESTEAQTRLGSIGTALCYAHVSRSHQTGAAFDIQYWVFYPYNGLTMGGHQGDWEHITVRVTPQRTIHSVYFAQHDGGEARGPNEVTRVGNQVTSYVAMGSHANYPTRGNTSRGLLPSDLHRGGGPVLDCAGRTINVGDVNYPFSGHGQPRAPTIVGNPLPRQQWLQYMGRWGEIGTGSNWSGPHGPARQFDTWRAELGR